MRIFSSALLCLGIIGGTALAQTPTETTLHIPAFTAYTHPDPEGLEISEKEGITGWRDEKTQIIWYGYLAAPGVLRPSVALRLPEGGQSRLRLVVAQVSTGEVRGSREAMASIGSDSMAVARFVPVTIAAPGYYRFTLTGTEKSSATYGDLRELTLEGPASAGAHFNLKERRNAASVHLGYPIPDDAKIDCFYNEVTVKTDPVASYYMACGFRRGYFGIQVNSPTERRIIFSIWDSGNEAVDRSKVGAEDRVHLLAKGQGVSAGDFGNEGTGGHSHLVYPWKTGDTYRFLVTVRPDGTHTIYNGYFFFPEKKAWGLIASFRAPRDGNYLRGLYSFNENFGGANGDQRRLAEFGPQWVRQSDGKWIELTRARFTHDATGKADRLDYGAGATSQGRFYLSNGGFIADPIHLGDSFDRKGGSHPPQDIPASLLPVP